VGLEVTILKVRHWGADEARKLFPYIDQCDVFCPENAHGLKEETKPMNRYFYDLRTQNTIEKKKFVEECFGNNEERLFSKTHHEYALLQEKMIFYLESFSKKQVDWLEKTYNEIYNNSNRSDSLEETYQLYRLKDKYYSYRDRHIAHKLEHLEDTLGKMFPTLKTEDLQVVISIGAIHAPERYMQKPMNVVQLIEFSEGELLLLDLIKSASENSFKKFREYFIENHIRKNLKNNLNTVKDLK
jgi:hypothetical protein